MSSGQKEMYDEIARETAFGGSSSLQCVAQRSPALSAV